MNSNYMFLNPRICPDRFLPFHTMAAGFMLTPPVGNELASSLALLPGHAKFHSHPDDSSFFLITHKKYKTGNVPQNIKHIM